MERDSKRNLDNIVTMTSGQLWQLLQTELQKETRDMDASLVRKILTRMESRDMPSTYTDDAAVQTACDRYRAGCMALQAYTDHRKPRHSGVWVRFAAAAAALVLVLGLLPSASGVTNILSFITKVTEDVVAFFTPAQTDNRYTYEFQTDHPGLQQLYDAVAEQGITEPVVPTWMPEEYELAELKVDSFPAKVRIHARFASTQNTMVITYDLHGMEATHEYLKDEITRDPYEYAGIIHEIYVNHEKYTVLWEYDNLKCSIVVDCREDQLTQILDSIYRWREDE